MKCVSHGQVTAFKSHLSHHARQRAIPEDGVGLDNILICTFKDHITGLGAAPVDIFLGCLVQTGREVPKRVLVVFLNILFL